MNNYEIVANVGRLEDKEFEMKNLLLIIVLILMVSVLSFGQEKDEVISLLNNIDISSTKYNNEIIFIEEFKFGIPGGINWLVQWYQEYDNSIYTFIYVVNTVSKEIKFSDQIGVSSRNIPSLIASYYKSLPGITIGNGSCQIADFNGDGFDEILTLHYGSPGPTLYIRGYDTLTGKRKFYCEVPFDKRENEPPPVEFITYKGMDGFRLRYFVGEVAGGPGWVPDPDLRNGVWIFYAWDADQRRYVEIEEVEEDGIESAWPVIIEQEVVEWKWKPGEQQEEELMPEETSAIVSANSGKNTRSNLYIVIIAAVALAAAVFIVVRRKKKTAK